MLTSYPETLVARVTGVKKMFLATTRRVWLEKGRDWKLVEACVHYTPAGLDRLFTRHKIDGSKLSWPLDASAAAFAESEAPEASSTSGDPTQPDPERILDSEASYALSIALEVDQLSRDEVARPLLELKVVKLSRNPTILYATEGINEYQVCVRSNANFLPGMVLKARAPGPGHTLWRMEGNCPRWRGRY